MRRASDRSDEFVTIWGGDESRHHTGPAVNSSTTPFVPTVKHRLDLLHSLRPCLRFGCECSIRSLD